MPEYTLDEMRDKAEKMARYFETGMSGFGRNFVAVHSGGTVLVIATGEAGERLREVIESDGIGVATVGVEDVNGSGSQTSSSGSQTETQPAPSESKSGSSDVVLIPMYHEPPPERRNKPGHIHLHALNGVTLGRRVRASGECLCGKKRGSSETTDIPDGVTPCPECVKVAADNGIAWSLA